MTINKRLEYLEKSIKPKGVDILEAWRSSREQGKRIDYATGEIISVEDWRRLYPSKAAVFDQVEKMEF